MLLFASSAVESGLGTFGTLSKKADLREDLPVLPGEPDVGGVSTRRQGWAVESSPTGTRTLPQPAILPHSPTECSCKTIEYGSERGNSVIFNAIARIDPDGCAEKGLF